MKTEKDLIKELIELIDDDQNNFHNKRPDMKKEIKRIFGEVRKLERYEQDCTEISGESKTPWEDN